MQVPLYVVKSWDDYGQIRVLLLKVEYSRDETIKLPGAKMKAHIYHCCEFQK